MSICHLLLPAMIPTEILDHIFSILHSEEDYTSLKTCSLIFPQIVDRHLYSQISFYTPPDLSKHISTETVNHKGTYVMDPTQLSQVLIDRPHIANYVRVVRIIVGLGSDSSESKWILPAISSILSNLFRIESIALLASWPLPWSTLDPGFCTAFRNSIRLPSIKEVILLYIHGFPLNSFDYCKNLRHLQLYGHYNGEGVSTSSFPRLSSLGVDAQLDWTRIVSWAKTNTIHSLSFYIHSHVELPQFRNLLKACSTTLIKLELERTMPFDARINSTIPVFPVLRLPLLEHIVFRSTIIEGVGVYDFLLFVPFMRFIQSISPPSPIRLTLHLRLHFWAASNIDWSPITNVLVLPIFRHPIELHITSWTTMDVVDSSLEQNSDMERLLENRKLVIIKRSE